jgi:hypothetical protein
MWKKYCTTRHATNDNIIWRMSFQCCITKARIQAHTQIMKYLLLLHRNNGYANALQCYVTRTLLVLLVLILYLVWTNICVLSHFFVGRDSLVGMAPRYRLDVAEIESRLRRDSPDPSRMSLQPTQPPVQWIPCPFPGWRGRGVCWPTTPI